MKPKIYKLLGKYEFQWELSYRDPIFHFKEWRRFLSWEDAIKYMVNKKIGGNNAK